MSNGTELQKELLKNLRSMDSDLQVTWNPKTETVSHLSGAMTEAQDQEPTEIAQEFLVENRALFGIESIEEDLSPTAVKSDNYGWHHVTYQQKVDDVPVWSRTVQVHVSRDGQIRSMRSNFVPELNVDPIPTVEPDEAVRIAAEDARVKPPDQLPHPPRNVVYVYEGEPRLAWVFKLGSGTPPEGELFPGPTYWEYFVDAHTGEIIARFNLINTSGPITASGESVDNPPRLAQTTKSFEAYQDDGLGTCLLQDKTRSIDIYDAAGDVPDRYGVITGDISRDDDHDWDNTTGMASTNHNQRINCQAAEVDAMDHLARVYDYYQSRLGRDSIDGAGMLIKCYVHIRSRDDNENLIAYNNAYWDVENGQLAFGDGQYDGLDGDWGDSTFYSGALDIVAHEFTHGVTAHEIVDDAGDPHGFAYEGEAGAANEMFSDVFGAFVDGNWRHGDNKVVGVLTAAGKVWRDLANPSRGLAYDPNDTFQQFQAKGVPQPDHYDIRFTQGFDYGGVHINSGILNFACYLATHGGVSHRAGRLPEAIRVYRKDRLGIGIERAEQIYYQALTNYFNNLDVTFYEVRQALLDACDQFRVDGAHGVDACDWKTLNTAFYAVGLHPVGEAYGPDPMITPWGDYTDDGPPYQSPDVWVEDAGGTHVNAEKGVVNRLVGRIHNIGDQAADNVRVRFYYSPFNAGYRHEHFMFIAEETVDLAAGQTLEVPVDWDLTDLGEDHGGLWPLPVNDFDHFCVRVEIVDTGTNDVNACNNLAQHNFVDVPTRPGDSFGTMMIIANPFQEFEAQIQLLQQSTLPEGWEVLMDGGPIPRSIILDPNEMRVVKLEVLVPSQPLIMDPIAGQVRAEIDSEMPGVIEGNLKEVAYAAPGETFRGRLSGTFTGEGSARFEGNLEAEIMDEESGELQGVFEGLAYKSESGNPFPLKGEIFGRLHPERRFSLGARLDGELIGGVDVNMVFK